MKSTLSLSLSGHNAAYTIARLDLRVVREREIWDSIPPAHKLNRHGSKYQAGEKRVAPESAHLIPSRYRGLTKVAPPPAKYRRRPKPVVPAPIQQISALPPPPEAREFATPADWRNAGCPHPVAGVVYAAKIASGLGWAAFERAG